MAGELQGALAYLEEGHMANPQYVAAKAEVAANGYLFSMASKAVVLNGPEADLFLVIGARWQRCTGVRCGHQPLCGGLKMLRD